MKRIIPGATGIPVSELALGASAMNSGDFGGSGTVDHADADGVIHAALDTGIKFQINETRSSRPAPRSIPPTATAPNHRPSSASTCAAVTPLPERT